MSAFSPGTAPSSPPNAPHPQFFPGQTPPPPPLRRIRRTHARVDEPSRAEPRAGRRAPLATAKSRPRERNRSEARSAARSARIYRGTLERPQQKWGAAQTCGYPGSNAPPHNKTNGLLPKRPMVGDFLVPFFCIFMGLNLLLPQQIGILNWISPRNLNTAILYVDPRRLKAHTKAYGWSDLSCPHTPGW